MAGVAGSRTKEASGLSHQCFPRLDSWLTPMQNNLIIKKIEHPVTCLATMAYVLRTAQHSP